MIPMFGNRLIRTVATIGCIACLSGCYYMQAARGQLEVMNKSVPIDEVVSASDTPADLSERLQQVKVARQFSIDELHLPDNDSYRTYADIERDYVVWNVFAAPEFSLEPKAWCFPVAGCVNYRGYFSEDAARRKADQLVDDGYDVAVVGIAAYSTLGKFSDPVLSTMMHWEDTDLIATLFHELAHQELYVKGDSEFNESFATAVEELGIERWLAKRNQLSELTRYRQWRELRTRLMQHVEQGRVDLEAIYSDTLTTDEMRLRKKGRLDILHGDMKREYEQAGRKSPTWLNDGINNARLASMSLYHARLPEFRALFAACDDDVVCFYESAKKLADRNP